MKIANSSVVMAANSKLDVSASKQTHLEYWVGDRRPAALNPMNGNAAIMDISALAKKLSLKALAAEPEPQQMMTTVTSADEMADSQLTDKDMQKIDLIEEFMFRLTGKRFKILAVDKEKLQKLAKNLNTHQLSAASPVRVQQRAGYGLIYDSVETYSEKQVMSFEAAGTVKTADGRSIDFNVQLNMSREFVSRSELHIREGDAKIDPLVINLDGAGPRLTGRDFSFDLDNDGDEEQISKLMAGSGFLALDKNGDGAVNNGGELFGPAMGNGFKELAAYDSDGNSWIDENDPIYDKLRIWMAGENGEMQLFALGQKGVGALYLGNVASAFDIKDAQNNSLGAVQSTGIFLRENGGAGTLQHIDLTV